MVTENNFWEKHTEHEQSCRTRARQNLKVRTLASLILSFFKRLSFSFVIIPGAFIFGLFLLSAYTDGAAETINTIFTGNGDNPLITEKGANNLILGWISLGLFIFVTSFTLLPWKSPVDRAVEREMDKWWLMFGNKLTVSEGQIKSELSQQEDNQG